MDLIKLFNLNLDPNRPIHYIIGVAVHSRPMTKNSGKIYMKYGPIVYTNQDAINYMFAYRASKMKFPKSTLSGQLKYYDLLELHSSLFALDMSCKANNCTKHHFYTDMPLTEDHLADYVKVANICKSTLQKLKDSEIR